MTEITYNEYWDEVNSMAEMLLEEYESEEAIQDHGLHESVDGHQWIIYRAYNDDVIRHSDNEEYYEQNCGADDMAYTLREKGFDGLKTVIAFYAFYADIADKLATMET